MLDQAVTFVLFSNLLISTICDGIRPSRSDTWHLKQEPFCGQSFVPEINRRIVGGSEANFGQFPWQAQIWTYKPYNDTPIFSCGGTLISEELILTAAHCVPFTNPERLGSPQYWSSIEQNIYFFWTITVFLPIQQSKSRKNILFYNSDFLRRP